MHLSAALLIAAALAGDAAPGPDPLAAELSRWTQALRTHQGGIWDEVRGGSGPQLEAAEKALAAGHRGAALVHLARARRDLAAAAFVDAQPEKRRGDLAAFEALWKETRARLAAELDAPAAGALDGVTPAVVRAAGEVALPQVREYTMASLDYGRSTTAEAGFFYLGTALAQRETVALCRQLSAPPVRPAPALRSLAGELDALEGDLVAAYRPPASIDRHGEFISAGGVLKEARELDAAGLRHGALLRYLDAAARVGRLRGRSVAAPAEADRRLAELEARLRAAPTDASIGELLVDDARAGGPEEIAAAAGDLLPRYFAALAPATPRPPAAPPGVTVTMVRWPYT